MRMTESTLRRIVREELLREAEGASLLPSGVTLDMAVEDFASNNDGGPLAIDVARLQEVFAEEARDLGLGNAAAREALDIVVAFARASRTPGRDPIHAVGTLQKAFGYTRHARSPRPCNLKGELAQTTTIAGSARLGIVNVGIVHYAAAGNNDWGAGEGPLARLVRMLAALTPEGLAQRALFWRSFDTLVSRAPHLGRTIGREQKGALLKSALSGVAGLIQAGELISTLES